MEKGNKSSPGGMTWNGSLSSVLEAGGLGSGSALNPGEMARGLTAWAGTGKKASWKVSDKQIWE